MSDVASTPENPELHEPVTAEGTPQEKLSRRQRYVRNAVEPLQREIERLKGELAQRPAAPQAEPEAPRPKRSDFASDEAFEDGLIAWSMKKTLAEKTESDAQREERQYFEQNLQRYGRQIEQARERYSDWNEVVNQEIFIGRESQLAIMELDDPAPVLYWLGRNPDRAAELGRLRPLAQAAAVGQISEYLRLSGGRNAETSDEGQFRRPSNRPRVSVPAPVRTVNTGSGAGARPSFADLAAGPNYTGKASDLKKLLREQR